MAFLSFIRSPTPVFVIPLNGKSSASLHEETLMAVTTGPQLSSHARQMWGHLSTLMSPYRPSAVPKGKLNNKRMFKTRVSVAAYDNFLDLAMMTTLQKTA